MALTASLWNLCLRRLEHDLPARQFNTWIRPLQATTHNDHLTLLAPNRFVRDRIRKDYLQDITHLASTLAPEAVFVSIDVGSDRPTEANKSGRSKGVMSRTPRFEGRLNPAFTFTTHVEGKSNQLARAAAKQVGENPGLAYNPLFYMGE